MPGSITLAAAGSPPVAAISLRMLTPWNGNWLADVELDPDLPLLPSGPAVITIATASAPVTLKGFIDPRAGGMFGPKASVRVVGGMLGGWDKDVSGQHFHSDAVVLNATVIAATAAEVGEAAVVAPPLPLGTDYVRSEGPASRVLRGLDWHVDPTTGTTLVAPRLVVPADPTAFQVLEFDPVAQRAEVAGDALLTPGMVLIDPRYGELTVRDVEQRWTGDGSRAVAWGGDAVQTSRLAGALQRLAFEACGVTSLRTYVCRVVLQAADGRLALQPTAFGELTPSTILQMIPTRFGIPGITVKIPPGTEVILEFEGGDPSKPYVRSFAGTPALEIDIDSLLVKIGVGSSPAARAIELLAWAGEVAAFAGNVASALAALGQTVAPLLPLSPGVASPKLLTD